MLVWFSVFLNSPLYKADHWALHHQLLLWGMASNWDCPVQQEVATRNVRAEEERGQNISSLHPSFGTKSLSAGVTFQAYSLCPPPIILTCSWSFNTECPHWAYSNLSKLHLSVCSYQLMVLLTSAPHKLLLALVLCGHLCERISWKRIYKYYLSIPSSLHRAPKTLVIFWTIEASDHRAPKSLEFPGW